MSDSETDLLDVAVYLGDSGNSRNMYSGGLIFKADFENERTGQDIVQFLVDHGIETELIQYMEEEEDETHEVNFVYYDLESYAIFRDELE